LNRHLVFIFLLFAVGMFLLRRYELAVANLLAFLGFALSDFRLNLVVLFRLPHVWEYRFRIVGNIIGYTSITAIFVMIALRFLKIYNF